MSYIATKGGPMIWYPTRVLLPVGIVAGLIVGFVVRMTGRMRSAGSRSYVGPMG